MISPLGWMLFSLFWLDISWNSCFAQPVGVSNDYNEITCPNDTRFHCHLFLFLLISCLTLVILVNLSSLKHSLSNASSKIWFQWGRCLLMIESDDDGYGTCFTPDIKGLINKKDCCITFDNSFTRDIKLYQLGADKQLLRALLLDASQH